MIWDGGTLELVRRTDEDRELALVIKESVSSLPRLIEDIL